MTGPLGESEARNRRTRRPNSISTRVMLIFTIGGAPDEAYYRRITRIPSSSADSQGSAAPAPTFMDIAGGPPPSGAGVSASFDTPAHLSKIGSASQNVRQADLILGDC